MTQHNYPIEYSYDVYANESAGPAEAVALVDAHLLEQAARLTACLSGLLDALNGDTE